MLEGANKVLCLWIRLKSEICFRELIEHNPNFGITLAKLGRIDIRIDEGKPQRFE